jgi:predicted nuclease of predicted toxin-antitoxin system
LKLLVDENLAPGLAEQIADLFPGSVHVTAVGLGRGDLELRDSRPNIRYCGKRKESRYDQYAE